MSDLQHFSRAAINHPRLLSAFSGAGNKVKAIKGKATTIIE
ncbi:hypothetical protein [Calothrix sp. NIES-2098]|nr:hypothetical protein NIES2098_61600 [Calothrix sp. NIES-2098]